MAVNRLNVGATNQLLAKASSGQSTNILELQNTAGVTVAGVDASGNPVGGLARTPAFKNLVINGDMQVAQRGTSTASITIGGYYTVDRWLHTPSSQGTWTMSVENDAPTGSGFRKSAKVLVTTADASPAASDFVIFRTLFEGQNLQHIAKGTSSAKQITLSFWVKANVTGTYIAELYDNDNTRQVSASYTVNSSATWEKKTITFPADTTGAFDNDNELSLQLTFFLGAGTDRTSGTLNTSWASATNANRAVGQTNLAASTNNYWQVTGVQLEVGNTATEFEFLPADVELAQCQRYYIRYVGTVGNGPVIPPLGVSLNTTMVDLITQLPVQMRAQPTVLDYSNLNIYKVSDGSTVSSGTFIVSASTGYDPKFAQLRYTHGSGIFTAANLYSCNSSTGNSYIGFGAEL
jgi:hypothetical protein